MMRAMTIDSPLLQIWDATNSIGSTLGTRFSLCPPLSSSEEMKQKKADNATPAPGTGGIGIIGEYAPRCTTDAHPNGHAWEVMMGSLLSPFVELTERYGGVGNW
uniref:Uncharacterized protein n=1 Tax=Anopheles coluzzii TaxID=1518534 RepID=A0A8W7PAG9_ANOCL